MKMRREWRSWLPLVVCAGVQALAAITDYTAWKEILPNQAAVFWVATCAAFPVLAVAVFIGWLLSFCFGFAVLTPKGLLWNCIKAKTLYYGMLIGLIGVFSVLGGMMTWRNDFPWGIISLSCLIVLPSALAFTYEYQGCRKLLPGVSGGRIVAYIAIASVLAAVVVIVLVLLILMAMFPLTGLSALVLGF